MGGADREHQTPAHRPEDHLGRELPALEPLTLHQRRPSIHPAGPIMPLPRQPQNSATEPDTSGPGVSPASTDDHLGAEHGSSPSERLPWPDHSGNRVTSLQSWLLPQSAAYCYGAERRSWGTT